MGKQTSKALPPRASDPVEDFKQLLTRLNPKAKAAVDKHLELCAADAATGQGRHWKRLAGLMGRLAPHVVEVTGSALKFHIADGKYRQQVFALEDSRKGIIRVFLGDVVTSAQGRGLLGSSDSRSFPVPGEGGLRLELEWLNAESKEVPDFCRPMLGWGRRAIHTPLSSVAEEKQVRAIERLCELAAEAWAPRPEASEPKPVAEKLKLEAPVKRR
jgi:hypothetical protein